MSHQQKPLHILSFTFYTSQSRYHHSSIHPVSYINYSWYITLRYTTTPPWFSHLLSPSFQVTCSPCHVQHSLSLTVELKKKVGRFWKKSHLHNNFLWKALFHRIFLQFLSDEKQEAWKNVFTNDHVPKYHVLKIAQNLEFGISQQFSQSYIHIWNWETFPFLSIISTDF